MSSEISWFFFWQDKKPTYNNREAVKKRFFKEKVNGTVNVYLYSKRLYKYII